MPMKCAFAEQTLDMEFSGFKVRVWRKIEPIPNAITSDSLSMRELIGLLSDDKLIACSQDIRDLVYEQLLMRDSFVDPASAVAPNVAAFLERVTNMPGVTAVQIIRQSGDGLVIYTEWP